MPRAPGEQSPNIYYSPTQRQRQQYRAQQQAVFQPSPIATAYPSSAQFNSPVSPLGTPGTSSPIASKSRPLYVPAVLRPTEFPSKEPPVVRAKPQDDEEPVEQGLRPNSSFMSLGGLSPFGRLSRRSTADSAKCVDGNWNLDQFPKPTGAPTRKHWKPDHESTMCDHTTCKRYFSYFTRRHHCRRCGNIFCDQHSAFEVPLDQDANFNPRGFPSRACGHCYSQFKDWRNRSVTPPSSQRDSPDADRQQRQQRQQHHQHDQQQQQQQQQTDSPATPLAVSPTTSDLGAIPVHTPGGLPPRAPEVAHSVPSDWNWSTF
ncbi:hypothetical protein N658DRAFT_482151 [Parathielavia hyrcaniae]|uniref:FYVE-type domain-containing protein n=1 Tax=Parathielavia hyrcaniae TaxID=113614 RepID=A0AAN6Q9Q0_9PEZI|nr:hypothetical protein N658DRAFT_482151 [Parathielavia hyrcaniae]